jgi:hypothetical protein
MAAITRDVRARHVSLVTQPQAIATLILDAAAL